MPPKKKGRPSAYRNSQSQRLTTTVPACIKQAWAYIAFKQAVERLAIDFIKKEVRGER